MSLDGKGAAHTMEIERGISRSSNGDILIIDGLSLAEKSCEHLCECDIDHNIDIFAIQAIYHNPCVIIQNEIDFVLLFIITVRVTVSLFHCSDSILIVEMI